MEQIRFVKSYGKGSGKVVISLMDVAIKHTCK